MMAKKEKSCSLKLLIVKTINSSGKKDGIGGIDAFTINRSPKHRGIKCSPASAPKITLARERAACLKIPPEKNIPKEAQP